MCVKMERNHSQVFKNAQRWKSNLKLYFIFSCQFLQRDPSNRLGCVERNGGEKEITAHPFFTDIDWEKLDKREIDSPFKPRIVSQARPERSYCIYITLTAFITSVTVICRPTVCANSYLSFMVTPKRSMQLTGLK